MKEETRNRIKIFKRLKQHYNYVCDLGYDVLFISLKGSQNYNLDIHSKQYESDIDSEAVVIPSIDDLISGRIIPSKEIILENNENIDLKDIRTISQSWSKQNVFDLESLFTDYRVINKQYNCYIKQILDLREQLAHINIKQFANFMLGIITRDYKILTKQFNNEPYYNYDIKRLHHLVRNTIFLKNYLICDSFKQLYTLRTDEEDVLLFTLKQYELIKEQAYQIMQAYYNKAVLDNQYYLNFQPQTYEELYIDKHLIDNQSATKLNNIVKEIIKDKLYKNFEPKLPKSLILDNYNNLFFISDTHFGHENILAADFEDRANRLNVTNIEEHDEALITKWNNTVSDSDLVFILGDFSFYKAKQTMNILKRLNGDKVLIRGNHDGLFLDDKDFDKSLFKEIADYKEIQYKNQNMCLMHYPINEFKHKNKDENPWIMVHGHLHSRCKLVPRHSFNVGADVNNFTPVPFDIVKEQALQHSEDFINTRKDCI